MAVVMDTENSFDRAGLAAFVPPVDAELSATVFVQSLAPASGKERQDQLVEGFGRLCDCSVLAGVDLVVWGRSVCTGSELSGIGTGARIVDAIDEFHDLAAESDLSIDPFFQVSNVCSEYSGGAFQRIVPPRLAIALHAGEDLVAVAPCQINGTAYTPEDLLSLLTRQRTTMPERLLVDESA
jgi:hypothetical protein